MPPDVLAKLNEGITKALQNDELKAAFAKFGLTPRGTSLAGKRRLHPGRI